MFEKDRIPVLIVTEPGGVPEDRGTFVQVSQHVRRRVNVKMNRQPGRERPASGEVLLMARLRHRSTNKVEFPARQHAIPHQFTKCADHLIMLLVMASLEEPANA